MTLVARIAGYALLTMVTSAAGVQEIEPDSVTNGTVTVGGQQVHYKTTAGTLTVGSTNEIDALLARGGRWLGNQGVKNLEGDPEMAPATARIFYVAYTERMLRRRAADAR